MPPRVGLLLVAAGVSVGGISIRCESAKDSGFGLDFSSYPQVRSTASLPSHADTVSLLCC